jgi:hypothetical protein
MDPAVLFIGVLVLAAAAVPFIILARTFSIARRQEHDYDNLARHLSRIERTVDQMVQRLGGGPSSAGRQEKEKPAVQPIQAAASPVPKSPPIEQPLDAIVEPEKPLVSPFEPPHPKMPPESESPRPAWQSFHEKTQETRPSRPAVAPIGTPSIVPLAPRESSRFETAAQEILQKTWRWILVGEDEVAEGESMEYAVARNWLLRVGVLILVIGIVLGVGYSIANGWLDGRGQVLLGTVVGLGMLVAGTQMLGRKYHLFGQGLIGAGIASLYSCVFVAHNIHHIVEDPLLTLGLMVVVTCMAGWIAVRFNSLLVAVLGILGGFGTPIMLRTGEANFVGLYAYLLVLSVGVFGVSCKKNWHLLNYLSFIGTYGLFFATMNEWHYWQSQDQYFWQVMPFVIGFFALYSTMTFWFNMAHRKKSTLLDVLALFINAGVFFGVSYGMVRGAFCTHGEKWTAVVSLALAAFYAAHVYYFLIRKILDRELLFSFIALASFFLAVTVPLALSDQWITASWAIQALVMLWIAGKLESEFLRHIAYLLYAFVLGRFGLFDLQQQYFAGHAAGAMSLAAGDYLWSMVERLLEFGIPIASLAGGGWLLHRDPPKAFLTASVGRENDIAPWIGRQWFVVATVAVVAAMTFLTLHLELNQSFGYFCPALRMPMLSLLWIGLCAFVLVEYRGAPNDALLGILVLLVIGLAVKLCYFDLVAWNITADMQYRLYDEAGRRFTYSFLDGGMRLLDFGAIIAFLGCGCYLLAGLTEKQSQPENAHVAAKLFGIAAVALLFVFLSLETNTALGYFMPEMRAGGISILWSLFALALLIVGMWKDARSIRYVGLALFTVVAVKVLFFDLVHLDQLYRIIAFLLLGVLMLCGSLLYIKCQPALAALRKKEEDEK